MPVTDDEIREKYLERAIREINALNHDVQACGRCPRGERTPVVGSGHPQADVVLLKHRASEEEVREGVAFHGRSGEAVLKALRALDVDPIDVYGTLCAKCPVPDAAADAMCVDRLGEELRIVQPRLVVVMGSAALEVLNGLHLPMAEAVENRPGVIQRLTPVQDVLVTPDVDRSLDDDDAKQAFWSAFRALGPWYAAHAID